MGGKWCKALMVSTALGGMAWASAAQAQTEAAPQSVPADQSSAQATAEDIIVTGSRTITNGNAAPMPVTVVSNEDLMRLAPSTIGDALAAIPQFRGSSRPASVASSQSPITATLNLRGLSDGASQRTLVLFDGRRINPSISAGQVDVNALPNLLIKRVDIVTGGASAAYGSDAVAGVVNYVLDRDFVGFKADLNAGISARGDNATQKATAAWGGKFLDDRLHILASGEYYNSDGISAGSDRGWTQEQCQAIQNPAYPGSGSNFLLRCGVVGTDLARGGVIVAGPLRGTQFLSGGTPAPYAYGTDLTAATMVGGDGVFVPRSSIAAPIQTTSLFFNTSYQVSDAFSVFAEAAYVRNHAELAFIYPFFAGATAFTIFDDNPYLPAATRDQMALANQTSIRVGRVGLDWGQSRGENTNENFRIAGGFDAHLGGDWIANGYIDAGWTTIDQRTSNMLHRARAYEAADAVRNSAGDIVCRSTLTNPGNGCVPLNIFGEGSASPDALSYILGEPRTHRKSSQIAAELAVRGSPFSTWAGSVKTAFGLNYRRITAGSVADSVSISPIIAAPGSQGTPPGIIGVVGGWLAGNQVDQPEGSYNVKEAFAEVTVPLASEVRFADSLDINAAIRYADYSTAGGATSWKLGITYSPIRDFRLRFTRSRDVRAPSISELYLPGATAAASVFDPVTNTTAQIAQITGGNINLRPEFADTVTFGAVLSPSFLPGATLAVDYYDIKVEGAIASIGFQQIVNLCAAGGTDYCQYVIRPGGPTSPITQVLALRQNLNSLRARGIDFEGNYVLPLERLGLRSDGALRMRALVSYLDRLSQTDAFGTTTELSGVNGGEGSGAPTWQGVVSLMYTNEPLSIFVAQRFLSGGRMANLSTPFSTSPTGPNSIDINRVAGRQYTDLTLEYQVGEGMKFYGTINNLFDRDPPRAPTRTGTPFTTFATNGTLYDVVGRHFTLGFRARF